MQTTAVVPSIVALAAALTVAPQLVHPVMIVLMMMVVAGNPLVQAMTTMLGTMISHPTLQKNFLIIKLESIIVLTAPLSHMATSCPNIPVSLMFKNLLVHPTNVTILLHQLERSMSLHGSPTPTIIPTILFTLMGLVTVTILAQYLHCN